MKTLCVGLAAALALILSSGCASTVVHRDIIPSYSVGQTREATVGEAFIVNQKGTVDDVRHWVGILHSPDGWKTDKRYSSDWVRQELLYSGKSGSTVEINYREFRGGYAAAPFYQSVKYDMNESTTIRFRNFVIDVISADNQRIKYRIVSDS